MLYLGLIYTGPILPGTVVYPKSRAIISPVFLSCNKGLITSKETKLWSVLVMQDKGYDILLAKPAKLKVKAV